MTRRIALLLTSISLVLAVSCGSKEVDKAKQYMDAGMYEQAVELLKMEVGANPKNAEAHFLLGTCYLMKNNQNEAQQSFERATLLKPKYRERIGEAYVISARKYLDQKDLRRGGNFLEQAVEKNFLSRETAARIMLEAVDQWPPDSDVNAERERVGSALISSINSGHTEIAKTLIRAGADVNATRYDGLPALTFSLFRKNREIALALLEAGADVNIKDDKGWTALMVAAGECNVEAVKALIEAGADVNAIARDNKTALRCANYGTIFSRRKAGHGEVVRLLKKAGAKE